MLPPFNDPSLKMPIPILLTSLWPEFNYMAIPGVKETGEFPFYPGKLYAQLAFGRFMIKEEGRMDIEKKLLLSVRKLIIFFK